MPDDSRLVRAHALLDANRPDAALVVVGDILSADPANPTGLVLAARAHLVADRPHDAIAAGDAALQVDPTNGTAAYLVASGLLEIKSYDRARRYAGEAIRLDPNDARAHALLAQLDSLTRRHADAVQRAEHAVRLAPRDPFTHISFGIVMFNQHRYRAAEQAFHHALSLDPQAADAINMLGRTLAHLGDERDAAELMELAAKTDFRREEFQKDMLMWLRAPMMGMSSWPWIVVAWMLGIGAAETLLPPSGGARGVAVWVLGSVPAGYMAAVRLRRQRLFSPTVRRELARRRRHLRSWWDTPGYTWGQRAILAWVVAAVFAVVTATEPEDRVGGIIVTCVIAGLAIWATVTTVQVRRRAQLPHPIYAERAA